MARTDSTGFHSPTAKFSRLGDYNGVTKVAANTTINFTGSRTPGAGFIVEDPTNVVVTAAGGGDTLPGTTLNINTFYPIGVTTVAIGSSGIVYVLHR